MCYLFVLFVYVYINTYNQNFSAVYFFIFYVSLKPAPQLQVSKFVNCVDTVPHPHDVHGWFTKPCAKNPVVHRTHGELGSASTMPCAGRHTHSVLLVVAVSKVVLLAGHCVHSKLLFASE